MIELPNIELKFIKPSSWPDVFEIWRQNEDYPNSHWIAHWQERGFKSWDDWRNTYLEPLDLKELEWGLYEITEPFKAIPLFHGGPFRSWIEKFYQGVEYPTFSDLATMPEIQAHQGIIKILANFPPQTTISAVVINGEAYVVEGMHRCAALALATRQKIAFNIKLYVALAQYNKKELPQVGRNKKDL